MSILKKTLLFSVLSVTILFSSQAIAGDIGAKERILFNVPIQLALSGNDATTYFTQSKPMIGSSNYVVRIAGKNYQFVNQQNMEKFKKDPKRYMPQFDGHCAYALAKNKIMDANPNVYIVHDGKLYLFKNKIALREWSENPSKNLSSGLKNWDALATFRAV